jgi:hypothetical protein
LKFMGGQLWANPKQRWLVMGMTKLRQWIVWSIHYGGL